MKNFREHIIVRGEHNILMIAMVQPEPPGCARISGARHNRGRQHPPCGTPSDPSNWNPVCAPYTPLDLPFTCKASSCCPSPLFTLTLNMRAVTWCWTLAQGSCLAMPYCDNVHVIGKESGLVERHRLKVCECLREKGFQVHEEVPANDVMPTLGGIVDGSAGVVRATPTRFWKIIVGFEHCLRKPVSSDFVRRLLGHAMVHRCEMAVFRSLYDFSTKGLGPCRLWKSAARECRLFIAIAPLLEGVLHQKGLVLSVSWGLTKSRRLADGMSGGEEIAGE